MQNIFFASFEWFNNLFLDWWSGISFLHEGTNQEQVVVGSRQNQALSVIRSSDGGMCY